MSGFKYGLMLGTLMFLLGRWAPQPAGSIVLWSALSAHDGLSLWILAPAPAPVRSRRAASPRSWRVSR